MSEKELNLENFLAIENVPCRERPKTQFLSTYFKGLSAWCGGSRGRGAPTGQKLSVLKRSKNDRNKRNIDVLLASAQDYPCGCEVVTRDFRNNACYVVYTDDDVVAQWAGLDEAPLGGSR